MLNLFAATVIAKEATPVQNFITATISIILLLAVIIVLVTVITLIILDWFKPLSSKEIWDKHDDLLASMPKNHDIAIPVEDDEAISKRVYGRKKILTADSFLTDIAITLENLDGTKFLAYQGIEDVIFDLTQQTEMLVELAKAVYDSGDHNVDIGYKIETLLSQMHDTVALALASTNDNDDFSYAVNNYRYEELCDTYNAESYDFSRVYSRREDEPVQTVTESDNDD